MYDAHAAPLLTCAALLHRALLSSRASIVPPPANADTAIPAPGAPAQARLLARFWVSRAVTAPLRRRRIGRRELIGLRAASDIDPHLLRLDLRLDGWQWSIGIAPTWRSLAIGEEAPTVAWA